MFRVLREWGRCGLVRLRESGAAGVCCDVDGCGSLGWRVQLRMVCLKRWNLRRESRIVNDQCTGSVLKKEESGDRVSI